MLDVEGDVVVEGKTKVLRRVNEWIVEVYSKNDLTAGNGARHDVLEGKGVLATETTCNVFELLRRRGLDIAYLQRTGPRTFKARHCEMIKLEVVVRAEAAVGSSYLKRHHRAVPGPLPSLEVEFYLKTIERRWKGPDGAGCMLPVDDPLLVLGKKGVFSAYHPGHPVEEQKPLLTLSLSDLELTADDLIHIAAVARKVFAVLQKAWLFAANGRLKDFKLEFGWYTIGKFERPVLLIADVIDNDSWRLEIGGKEVSKEIYRQRADLAEVLHCYQLVAERTLEFGKFAA